METITYSLKNGKKNSEDYYREVRKFTNDVVLKSAYTLMPHIDECITYLRKYRLEEIRKKEEYLLELLSFGILWSSYANQALFVKHAPFVTLARMAEWRKKHKHLKPVIDLTRGFLITLFLLPQNSNDTFSKENLHEKNPTLEEIDHVCKWFEATGEFREQALRFILWRAFWETKGPDELKNIFSEIDDFTFWFKEESEQRLGKYTKNVESFLQNSAKHYYWREDRISCSRKRLEYHLNMVGAELMNRAFRNDFTNTDTKAVLVPGCMRSSANGGCKAKKVKEGLLCTGCSTKCRVNHLRLMGKENDSFEVYIIPHASDLSLWSPAKNNKAPGVIAAACVTTLVEGGWELKRYNVPAQCVLLDYCGCKKHWHKEGFPTSFNKYELERISA